MPGLPTTTKTTKTTERLARINFTVPKRQIPLDDQAKYLARFDARDLAPRESREVPIVDLRDAFDDGRLASAKEQLDLTGYAVVKHASRYATLEGLASIETMNAYLDESRELYKELLGADEVVVWNSDIRCNDGHGAPDLNYKLQTEVQKDRTPSENVRAVASAAHIDQDEQRAREVAKTAAGDDVFDKYRRVQIVNLWRPLKGPVTNAPLAACDYRGFDSENDLLRVKSAYGDSVAVSYSPGQRWAYVSHQMPDEVLLLRCYDSNMGIDGEALFSAHSAVEIVNEPAPFGREREPVVPRTSVEVRFVVLHK